ncbi:MAG: hypothetical protein IIA60_00535 [Candidatus Marinimicrobia bacterium]|nr:hypothetical protein [Candidatus Neomarinimicrobiota bacterium]
MVDKVNYLRVIGGMVMGLLWGCGESNPGAYVIFIDYTTSAATFENGNPSRIQTTVLDLVTDMDREDVLQVYPIHAFTESATPVLRLSGPELHGDLNDGMRRREWMEGTVVPMTETIAKVRFARDRVAQTNIYPVARKIARLVEAGYIVHAVLVSDLIQDFNGEDFSTVFGDGSSVDPVQLARKKVIELGLTGRLEGVKVVVMIPGSPHGNQMYDKIRAPVNEFWKSFFTHCGATVMIGNL